MPTRSTGSAAAGRNEPSGREKEQLNKDHLLPCCGGGVIGGDVGKLKAETCCCLMIFYATSALLKTEHPHEEGKHGSLCVLYFRKGRVIQGQSC